MRQGMFENRSDAGRQLAARLRDLRLEDPLVLAIPRGGVEVGAVLAAELGAEFDVVLSRKLRAPGRPELALGAVSETGDVHLDHWPIARSERVQAYLDAERSLQMAEIARRAQLFRAVRPKAKIAGRSVIVTDDGIATGSTMIAALQTVRGAGPHELIVAVPVASEERLEEVRPFCDRVVCLLAPADFWAVGQFYDDFTQVPDERVVELLRERCPPERSTRSFHDRWPGRPPDESPRFPPAEVPGPPERLPLQPREVPLEPNEVPRPFPPDIPGPEEWAAPGRATHQPTHEGDAARRGVPWRVR